MRHFYLGLAAGYSARQIFCHTFAIGTEQDRRDLCSYLIKKYEGEAFLTKNGRSGLALALKAFFEPGDAVIVNGFTCFAVYEALKKAKIEPVWADISRKDLNFTVETLKAALKRTPGARGIIVQNSLGHPVDMAAVEQFAKEHHLIIIEDLAHSAGLRYPDGREAGTVGAAAILSFGKDKTIDATSGGAAILRYPYKNTIKAPTKSPRPSDVLRARFYPLLGALTRGLSYVHLSGVFMRFLLRIHWVEKSADNRLEISRKIAKFEAKCALKQLQNLPKSTAHPLRDFYLVHDRAQVLAALQAQGYYFSGLWYEKPVSPERYYAKVDFPEADCPVATSVTSEIINFPTYYKAKDLAPARRIVQKYLMEDQDD